VSQRGQGIKAFYVLLLGMSRHGNLVHHDLVHSACLVSICLRNQLPYDLFIDEVVAAWADSHVCSGSRWHFEGALPCRINLIELNMT
jgi:hypothetical protein